MKKAIATVILVCLVCQSLVQLGIIGWYALNKKYIAEKLCENKDKPQMHCNGKCYLKKKLKKATEQENKSNNTSSRSESIQFVSFILPSSWQPRTILFTTHLLHFGHYRSIQGDDPLINIFHPPQVV